MFYEVITGTDIMFYLMIAVGVIGGVAKVVNLIYASFGLARAAGNMSKSTHRLIRLVRAKYEHACMLHDRVENAEAFVEKYIYEYRGMGFRIHTWRQLEVQSIWFAGILAALGAVFNYTAFGMANVCISSQRLEPRRWSCCCDQSSIGRAVSDGSDQKLYGGLSGKCMCL